MCLGLKNVFRVVAACAFHLFPVGRWSFWPPWRHVTSKTTVDHWAQILLAAVTGGLRYAASKTRQQENFKKGMWRPLMWWSVFLSLSTLRK